MESKIDKERNEDLNPLTDDIEERVKKMLDLSVPDDQKVPETKGTKSSNAKSKGKTVPLDKETSDTEEAPLSAPVLPSDTSNKPETKLAPSKSKKVIIPISHDIEPENAEPKQEASETIQGTSEADTDSINEITIDDDKTSADIAEELDAAIAGLDPDDKDSEAKETITSLDDKSEPLGEDTPKIPETTPDAEDVPVTDPAVLTDPQTDKAVEEIIADESDELLEFEDAVRESDAPAVKVKKQRRGFGQVLKSWWAKPAFRWAVLITFLLGLGTAGVVPDSRYFVLNSVGVRAASSLTVFDASTQQPLKNVTVKIGNNSAVTDVNGKVQLRNVRLGNNTLTVEKRAFAPISKDLVLGWGSNPLGDFKLTPTGSQYIFKVTDFLSAKPISKVEASSGEAASALSDEDGIIKLTVDKPDDQELNINIKGENYRVEQFSINPDNKDQHDIKLVPSRKQVFISKRSGKFDIYSVYIDGRNEELVLSGSGHEREDNLVLVPHPSANVVAYVSNRADQKNSDGFLLSNLILVNLEDNSTTNIGAAERVQIVDWSKDYLVYVQIASGTSANSPKRYRLMSYNYRDETNKELASSNFFNDVISAGGHIYYAPSSAYQSGPTNFYKVSADGSGSQVIYNKEVWNVFRTSYDHFALSVQQQWYDYKLGGAAPTKLNSAPANQITQVYIDNPDGKTSAWIDNRDGKGVLLHHNISDNSDTTLKSQAGLTYPIRWLSDKVVVYRIKSPSETADYAISIDGGEPVKIRDVTNSGGIDRWYYY